MNQKLVYFSAEGQTFYLDANDTEVDSSKFRKLLLSCDFAWTKNNYGQWQFIKNRYSADMDSEYFDLKDLLNDIPLNETYYKRSMLNKCKYISSPIQVEQIIEIWAKARNNITRLTTPWYEQ